MTNPHKYIANESFSRVAIMNLVSRQTLSEKSLQLLKGVEGIEKITRYYVGQLRAAHGMRQRKQCTE